MSDTTTPLAPPAPATGPAAAAGATPFSGPGLANFLRSPAAKVGLILGLLLLMQIPLAMVSSLIEERQGRQEEVLTGFRRGWGPEQTVFGPALAVPYVWTTPGTQPGDPPLRRRGWARLAPGRLAVTARLSPETRHRGLFQATVYVAEVALEGTMTVPPLELKDAPGAQPLWNDAVLVLGAADLRGLPADLRLDWNGGTVPLTPRTEGDNACSALAMVTAPARLSGPPDADRPIAFRTVLALRGTQAFHVSAAARQTDVKVSSPWRTPGFTGAELPLAYEVGADGFAASWQVSGGAAAAGWQLGSRPGPDCQGGADYAVYNTDYQLGVELRDAVPTYQMVSRAAKYGMLFMALSFLTYFLFEALSGQRIHLVQYGLLGLSISLFALILVSVAEPLGFAPAYAISTAAVLAQASLYTWSVTGRARLAAVFGGVLAVLFGFLYVVLSLEAYSLLVGTAALFAILSVIMAVTRRVDWSGSAARTTA